MIPKVIVKMIAKMKKVKSRKVFKRNEFGTFKKRYQR